MPRNDQKNKNIHNKKISSYQVAIKQKYWAN